MTVFALETSCDETSAAVVREGRVLANRVASQIQLHAKYGGVVPELAAREHLKFLVPTAQQAWAEAGVRPAEITAVAATQGPGLPNALWVGFAAAQAMAFALRKPFYGVHHHEAHLYSAWIGGDPPQADLAAFEPAVALIVSGGHTLLVHVPAECHHRVLGGTMDDAAGECFDKVAKLLGLPYPGGPALERLATEGNPEAYDFPRPMLHNEGLDFSFSGLKTSVRYFLQKHPQLWEDRQGVADVCASVQAAIVDVLVAKTLRAAQRVGVRCVTASGGVTCNARLRQALAQACQQRGYRLRLAERAFCTDNAAMVALVAERKLRAGFPPTPLDAEARPGWRLDSLPLIQL